ncbi:hypothetical protein C7271_02300 [filamentous cyanobacterium CCP5]|nr:hypothetical protein C7271_02300 [filamentous cyanobacterium CCP5]
MVCFRDLFTLPTVDVSEVGDKAYTLAQLKRWGLPVPPTWVLGPEPWLEIVEALVPTGEWAQRDAIALQQMAQGLGKQLDHYRLDFDRGGFDLPLPLILRCSLSICDAAGQALPLPQDFQGLLAGQICSTQPDVEQLRQLWGQVLRAQNLRVWRHHGLTLNQLQLSLIAHPLVPAAFSGTLLVVGDRAWLEVVAGLGVSLSQGEAVPACCQVEDGHHSWQPGYQDRSLQVDLVSRAVDWQWCPEPTLAMPLTQPQVNQLLQLGRQAQRHIGSGVRLEWLVEEPEGLGFVITQAAAWQTAESGAVATIEMPIAPALPSVQAAIRGIPAATGRGLASALVLKAGTPMPDRLPAGCIVVAEDIQPDLFGRAADVVGIVTEAGSATCHAAILARERGIPAVVGAPHAVSLIATGDPLWLDGDKGIVYIVSEVKTPWRQPSIAAARTTPDAEKLETRTRVMVNLSQASRLADHAGLIDGVGLVRSEWLLLEGLEGRHPQHWIEAGQARDLEAVVVERLRPILAACPDKPVRYRSLDLRSHEWTYLQGSPSREVNPMLGLRGTFSYQQDSRLFETELAALRTLQEEGYEQLELILPFVRTVEEVQACQHQISRAGLPQVDQFCLWIMAEVPSVLFLLPAYAKAGIQGIAIGTNDLTQLLLAVDREQPLLAATYDERHPAVLAALQYLIRQAQAQGMGCSLCGQAPVRFPELIDSLVDWGIDSICVELAAIAATRKAIAAAETKG